MGHIPRELARNSRNTLFLLYLQSKKRRRWLQKGAKCLRQRLVILGFKKVRNTLFLLFLNQRNGGGSSAIRRLRPQGVLLPEKWRWLPLNLKLTQSTRPQAFRVPRGRVLTRDLIKNKQPELLAPVQGETHLLFDPRPYYLLKWSRFFENERCFLIVD